jgi:hypothetical protein
MSAEIVPLRPARILPLRPPHAPPLHANPDRFGNGRVEVQVYPAASAADRVQAAVTLLRGTGYRVTGRDA